MRLFPRLVDILNTHAGPWQDVVDEQYSQSLQATIEDIESKNEVGSEWLKGAKRRAETSRPGHTLYESLGEISVNGITCTRLKLCPQTGRTHQLRVFCRSHLNRGILGDTGYMHGGLAGERWKLRSSISDGEHSDESKMSYTECYSACTSNSSFRSSISPFFAESILAKSDWDENGQAALEDEARRAWGGRMCLHAGELRFHHRFVNQEIIVRDEADYFACSDADVI